jgi:hypothetical protein
MSITDGDPSHEKCAHARREFCPVLSCMLTAGRSGSGPGTPQALEERYRVLYNEVDLRSIALTHLVATLLLGSLLSNPPSLLGSKASRSTLLLLPLTIISARPNPVAGPFKMPQQL